MANPLQVPPYAPPPGNMTAYSVLGTPAGTDVLIQANKLTIAGIGEKPRLLNVLSVAKTAYAAGTLKVMKVTVTAPTTPVDTTLPYDFFIQAEGNTYDQAQQNQYTAFASAATAASLVTALVAQINADPLRIVNAVDNTGGVMTLTQISLVTGDFLFPTPPPSLTVVTLADGTGGTTAYVRPSGTLTDIIQYTSSAVTGTTFDKFVVSYWKATAITIEGKTQFIESSFVVFINTGGGAGYTASGAALSSLFSQVTQITTISTGVTSNSDRGVITTVASTLASVTPAVIILTNSEITTLTPVKVSIVGGTWTAGVPVVAAQAPGAGSISISLSNAGTAALNGTVQIAYEVVVN